MQKSSDKTLLAVALVAITLPYLLAALLAGKDWVFSGFLLNPMDGATYLAKMRQGYDGAWRFVLPYTAEPGNGAYVYLYYLFLGHTARITGISLILLYHIARIFGAVMLLLALHDFLGLVFADKPDQLRMAKWLAVIGSGMGWLIVFLGPPPIDFWVAEAYPFLSMYTNPHFPLGLALVLWLFANLLDSARSYRGIKLAAGGLLLSVILPFGIAIVLPVAVAWLLWTWMRTRRFDWLPVAALGSLGGPYLLYQYWATMQDPVLAGWNAQNITLTPPVWSFWISFSPAIILALVGIRAMWRQPMSAAMRLVVTWFFLGMILVYIPFPLQRRFMLGFFIPTAVLAVSGLGWVWDRFPRHTRQASTSLFGLALPTNILILLLALLGAVSHSPFLYLSRDESAALDWINQNTPEKALILAAPEVSLWIPGWTGRRVIYGHPYETVNAEEEKAWVMSVLSASGNIDTDTLKKRGVQYLVTGPEDMAAMTSPDNPALGLQFESGDYRVYVVKK